MGLLWHGSYIPPTKKTNMDFMDRLLYQLLISSNLLSKDSSLRSQVLVSGNGYSPLDNIMRDVHPALSPYTVATKISIMRSGDSLEDHLLNLQEYIDKETLHN